MSTTKINNLHDALVADNHIVELQVPMRKTHAVQVGDAVEDLQEAAPNLFARHLASHDNGEEVKGSILHHLEPASLFLQDIQRLDNVAMVESRSNAELGSHLFVVFPLRFIRVACSKLLDGEDGAIFRSTHEPDGPTGTGPQYLAEFAVL